MLGGGFCVLHFASDGSNYFWRVLPSWTRITFGTLHFIASKNGNPRLITSTAPSSASENRCHTRPPQKLRPRRYCHEGVRFAAQGCTSCRPTKDLPSKIRDTMETLFSNPLGCQQIPHSTCSPCIPHGQHVQNGLGVEAGQREMVRRSWTRRGRTMFIPSNTSITIVKHSITSSFRD